MFACGFIDSYSGGHLITLFNDINMFTNIKVYYLITLRLCMHPFCNICYSVLNKFEE